MPRLPALALAALLVLPCAATAQQAKAPAAAEPKTAAPPAEVDPKVQAAIDRAVEKAKEEVRNEVRAELQGAQSAAEFMGATRDVPRPELLELDGYFRLRGAIDDRLHLRSANDASGYSFFPRPRHGPWLSTANMRLRLEPTINASETVRVHMQVDVLDNYVLGSSASKLSDGAGSPYPIPFYGTSRTYTPGDKTNDRDAIIPRRVWAEVQTPVGLLTFGRQPSSWGLGMLANAGTGLDSDFGDTVDRIQFAFPPVGTPVGDIVAVPMLDFDFTGPLAADPHYGAGMGQPINADQTSKGSTLGLKLARIDTDDQIRRQLEAGKRSVNFGLYYSYRSQRNTYPAWLEQGFTGTYTSNGSITGDEPFSRRGASAHIGSLWARYLSSKWRLEGELAAVYGRIGHANIITDGTSATTDKAFTPVDHVNLNQWGLLLQTEYKKSTRLAFGMELGAASGDSAPGFGNAPDRRQTDSDALPAYGSIEGPQWGRAGDHSINNFRMNPAHTPDLILYRRILGGVTDSWYLRPSVRWDLIPGLTFDGAAIYSQAMYSESTPSSSSSDQQDANSAIQSRGHKPLGLELDGKLTLSPSNGFHAWGDVGMLKPLAGMGAGTSVAWVFEFGLAATF